MRSHPVKTLLALFTLAMLSPPAAWAGTGGPQVSTRQWTDAAGARWTETTTVEIITDDRHAANGNAHDAADNDGSAGDDGTSRLVGTAGTTPARGIARFGPFMVLDRAHAALIDATDSRSPARFSAMLRAFPAIRVLEMADCPGTLDDTANLLLGRMIRARAIATDIPRGGSVRSGAVDLFLAGAARHAAADADFGVHAWQDDRGREPADFAADAPVNRAYLDYYRAMGMTAGAARAFYALTNSVPNATVRWLHTADIARFVPVD